MKRSVKGASALLGAIGVAGALATANVVAGADPSTSPATPAESPAISAPVPAVPAGQVPSSDQIAQTLSAVQGNASSIQSRGLAPTDVVEGAGADPQPLDPRAQAADPAARIVPMTFKVIAVQPSPDPTRVTATVISSLNGYSNEPSQVPFVLEAGQWKLEKAFICASIKSVGRIDPAC